MTSRQKLMPGSVFLLLAGLVCTGLVLLSPYRHHHASVVIDPWDDSVKSGDPLIQVLTTYGRS